MPPNEKSRPGVGSRSGLYDSCANSAANVIPLFPKSNTTSPFQQLTARMVIAQHRNGTLQEAVLIALLAGVGLQP